ncbi:MAG: ABC transporter ATP-binding protein [Castellaniella sp.]|nr:ABC transporter ATP-binding protein [Castellaniella sp.]
MKPMLSVEHLVKRFGGLVATNDLSLQVHHGEIHALIGPNGAGKTTVMSQLTGELLPDAGSIVFDGRNVTGWPVARRALAGMARSYQITQLLKDFSVLENVLLMVQARLGHSFGCWRPVLRQRRLLEPAMHALDQVGLAARAHDDVLSLAHGEHRQLELAMALAMEPRLLLLDEPLAGMSQAESSVMVKLLLRLKRQYTILLVEHDMQAVFALADRASVLVYGQEIACGVPAEIQRDPEVRKAYLGDEQPLRSAA